MNSISDLFPVVARVAIREKVSLSCYNRVGLLVPKQPLASMSFYVFGDSNDVERLTNLPILGMVGVDDKKIRIAGIKRMVEHPLSGVTDKNRNGIGDHLE